MSFEAWVKLWLSKQNAYCTGPFDQPNRQDEMTIVNIFNFQCRNALERMAQQARASH
jgi:hypothetical protein